MMELQSRCLLLVFLCFFFSASILFLRCISIRAKLRLLQLCVYFCSWKHCSTSIDGEKPPVAQ